jgi:O-antigen ligase/cytochrome c-type biogenesis protein CcmH/NrfG
MPQKSSVKRAARVAKRQGKGRSISASSSAVGWREIALVLVCVELAVFILVFDPGVRDTFDLPKATFTHALAWVLLGVTVVVGLADGIKVPVSPLFLAFYALLAAELLTTVTATNQYVAVYGEVGRYLGLTTHAVLALIVVVIAFAADYPRRVSWLAWSVAVAAVAASVYAVVQATGADPVIWVDQNPRVRPFATFGNPDFYGQFLSAVVIASIAALAFGWTALGRLRWALVALGATSAALMVIVATRGSAIGVVAGVLVLALLWLRRAGTSRRALQRLALAGAAFLILSGIVVVATPIGGRLLDIGRGIGLRDRVLLYQSAAQMFVDHPVTGVGFENFAVAYPRYQQAEWFTIAGRNTTNTSAHNWILHLAGTMGALGLVTTAALLALVAIHTWQRAKDADSTPLLVAGAATAAYYGSGLVLPGAQSIHWIPWACLGVALASDLRSARSVRVLPGTRLPSVVQLLIVLAFSAAAFVQLSSLSANRSAKTAETSLRPETAARSVAAARAATTQDPGRAVYWNDLGRALELVDDQAGARAAYIEATSRSPYTPAFWWNLSRMHQYFAQLGDQPSRAAAYEALRQAIAAAPQNPDTFDRLARMQIAFGDYGAAVENARLAIAYFPSDTGFYTVAADAARQNGNVPQSLDFLRQGVANTNSNPLRLTLARRLIEAALYAEARTLIQAVLALEPANVTAVDLLKQVEGR